MVVVFPAPLWPRKDVIWFSKKLMFRWLTAGRQLPSNTLTRSSICTPITRPSGSGSKNSWPAVKKTTTKKSWQKNCMKAILYTTRCRSFITMRLHVCVHTAHPPSLTPDISPPDWDFPVVFSAAPSPSPVAPSSPGVCRFSCCLNRCRYLSLAHPGSQHPSLSSLVQGP